nr:reverse transcriptase domain-containing protein [Tanacetum cinerariifolium]
MQRLKPNKTTRRHNGPKLSPGQTGYGPEAARQTKGFQMTLSQGSETEKFNKEKERNEKLKEVKALLNFEGCCGTSRYSESRMMNTKEYEKRHRSRRSRSPRPSPGVFKNKTQPIKIVKSKLERKRRECSKGWKADEGVCPHAQTTTISAPTQGIARVWFDDLPPQSIDSYGDLKKAFMENYLQQKKCIRYLIKLHNIKQRDGKSTENFVRMYKLESKGVKGAPECMRISGFVHGIINPELIKPLYDKIPKTVDEMMRVTTSFLRGKWQPRITSERNRFHHGNSKRKRGIQSSATNDDSGRKAKSYQILQNNRKEQPKVAKKGETSMKDKALAILMVQPWKRVARKKITQSFYPNTKIFFPPLDEEEGTEGPMIIEAEIGGHCIHRMYVDGGSASKILANTTTSKDWRRRTLRFGLDEFRGGKVTISVQRNYWKTRSQETASSSVNSSRNAETPGGRMSNYPKKQQVGPAGMRVDAYKGYHRIQMAKEYEEKIAFITSQGIFCYTNMPFGLRNTKATYERLVDNAFHKQIGRNLEVYMDDLVIKSRTKDEIVRDIEERFKTLRSGRGVQENETANSGASHADRTNGKRRNLSSIWRQPKKRPRVSVKGQILANFIVKRPEEDSPNTLMEVEELPEPWILFTDGSSSTDGSEAGLILINPEGIEFTYALRFRFDATNNEVEYEALIARLRIAEQMGQGKVKFLIVAIDYFIKWIEAKPITTITGSQIKKFMRDNIVCRFKLPGEIISDNGKQFQDNPFKDWREKLCIRQHFAFIKHPQTNGLVERANHSLGEGIKARLDARSNNWMEELPHVLWAHHTMIKSSNGDTLFSLIYGTEAIILAEIGMPTL